MATMTAAEKENKLVGAVKKISADWDRIREMIDFITRSGGEVVNRHGVPRTFTLPFRPGLSLLAAADCLTNYGGFTRLYSEDEIGQLEALRHGYNVSGR